MHGRSGTRSSVVRTSVIFTDRAYNGGVTSALLTAGNGLGIAHVWDEALESALDAALSPLNRQPPDLVLLFADASFAPNYVDLLAAATERSHAQEVVGCSASGVIAGDRELEDEPAIAALAVCLPPGSLLRVAREPDRLTLPECTGLIVLADPYTTDVMQLIADLERTYPRVPLVGGLATGAQPQVFGGQSVSGGAVIVGLGGAAVIRSVVSQGCEPIGAPWTITSGERNIIRTIGNRPAYQVLVETIQQLEPTLRQRAARNLLVGLAMDEYRDEFKRGDFLIRNLMGAEPSSGALAVGAEVHIGQTLQFQIRDARAADEELRHMLAAVPAGSPAAALLFACNGRGKGLFGVADHDASTVRELLGPLPLAGLFCNGEIGPVGRSTYLHGFTASLGLIAAEPD